MGDSLPAGSAKAGASGMSIGAAGLKAYGDITSSQGVAAADTYKAQVLQQNAQRGHVAAVQTGADLSQRLATTLGNIDAMRAAGHGDPSSPSAMAFRNQQEAEGTSQKAIAVDQIEAEAKQKESDANYLQYALQPGAEAGQDFRGRRRRQALWAKRTRS